MLEKISSGLLLVHGKNEGRFPYSHSVIIKDRNEESVLLDTGCGIEILQELKKRFRFSSIINSHTHPDHTAGNWLFENEVRAIYVPQEGFNTSGNMIALSERLAEPGPLAKYWKEFVAKTMGFRDCRPTDIYGSKSSFDFAEVSLQPIHTPGHTMDHYCFYEPNLKILFSFDYDLTSFGPWYGHRESSIEEFKKSIADLKELDVNVWVSGHKGIITKDIKKQLDEFNSKFNARDEKIITLLKNECRTINQLVEEAPIYGKFTYAEPLLRYWEKNMIGKHLEQLINQGRVIRLGEEYRVRE
jgi:glyoxylase-like metal-dependent hydrolase (beta-lactamase superfamily II)